MKFLEKDLEEILWEQFKTQKGRDVLASKGLWTEDGAPNPKFKRQLNIGKYGRADVVSFSKSGGSLFINVYELKKDKISMSAFLQAVGYCKGIQRYIKKHRKSNLRLEFNVILIGKTIDISSEFSYLPDFINGFGFNLHHFTYNYNVDGISFNYQSEYALREEGFTND